jgi:hypothetical protein
MRLYSRKRAEEFEWLADNYPIFSVRLRYIARTERMRFVQSTYISAGHQQLGNVT